MINPPTSEEARAAVNTHPELPGLLAELVETYLRPAMREGEVDARATAIRMTAADVAAKLEAGVRTVRERGGPADPHAWRVRASRAVGERGRRRLIGSILCEHMGREWIPHAKLERWADRPLTGAIDELLAGIARDVQEDDPAA